MNTRTQEAVGPNYDSTKMLEARTHTFRAIARIAAAMRPGMRESEGVAVARSIPKEMGLLRGWHGVYVRFGENTLCTYNVKETPDVTLAENDIFYIDIGAMHRRRRSSAGGPTRPIGAFFEDLLLESGRWNDR